MIAIRREDRLPVEEFRRVLVDSTLGERRPVDDPARLERMLAHADPVVTACATQKRDGSVRDQDEDRDREQDGKTFS